jgi:hypothetical protein
MTTAMLKSTWAAMTVQVPICARSPATLSRRGFTVSNTVTNAISVEMPITTLGTMMAM